VAVDFKKAFDSISHDHLWRTLGAMGVPKEYITWVQILLNKAESAVINNGRTTRYFPLQRSCRQGDPISPYLFILALEPLIRKIKGNKKIEGEITPEGREVKVSVYADDLTLVTKEERHIQEAFAIIEGFSQVSGLFPNWRKTEILAFNQ
jgi:hypothetical protein